MKTPDRDLLVLMKDEFVTEQFMAYELEKLNDLLYQYETLETFCVAHEVFDLNSYKILRGSTLYPAYRQAAGTETFSIFV